MPWQGALYNCAAVFHKGRLLGLSAKTYIPNYSEFYEARHFTAAPQPMEVTFAGQKTWLGQGLLYCCENVRTCWWAWRSARTSEPLASQCQPALNGATVILNPSCSDEPLARRSTAGSWCGSTPAAAGCLRLCGQRLGRVHHGYGVCGPRPDCGKRLAAGREPAVYHWPGFRRRGLGAPFPGAPPDEQLASRPGPPGGAHPLPL